MFPFGRLHWNVHAKGRNVVGGCWPMQRCGMPQKGFHRFAQSVFCGIPRDAAKGMIHPRDAVVLVGDECHVRGALHRLHNGTRLQGTCRGRYGIHRQPRANHQRGGHSEGKKPGQGA